MDLSLLALVGCIAMGMPDPSVLQEHNPVWEKPAIAWNTGIPLGNGHIGALIWGDGQPLKITLDKYDAWETREKPLDGLTYAKLREWVRDGKKEEAEACMRTEAIYGKDPYPTRLPMPRLELDLGAPFDPQTYEATLNLYTGQASISGTAGGKPVKLEIAVPMHSNVLLITGSGDALAHGKIRVGFDHLQPSARETLKNWGYADPEINLTESEGTLHQRTPSGYEYAAAWKRMPIPGDSPDRFLIVLSLQSLDVKREIEDPLAAAREAVEQWTSSKPDLTPHEAWWAKYWKRSWLAIPDARLEALYFIEMYKLACSSQPDGLPITLQGVWTLDGGMPPWSGDYHLDMNVQQSYWPIYTANRLDLGEPLYRTFSECIPKWRKQCQNFFGFDGVWAGCAIGPHGERIYGYSGVELWPGNVAWLAHMYWLHYLYSMDKQFLTEQALPLIRLSFLTYANLLEKEPDGKLHVPLSYSPEYHEGSFKSFAPDPNCDLALIRFLGGAILKSNEALGVEEDVTPRVKDVLANLTDYAQDDGHLRVSGDQKLEHSHRHHSHLMMIHPLGLVTPDGSDADRRMIQNSLHDIRTLGTGQWTGWAFPWMSLIASRTGYGNWAWQMLDTYANSFITPNTFHINGDPRVFGLSLFDYDPMTLEAGFGAAAAIQEMLIQSNGGEIRLFPSIPDRWHDAYFEDLRTEGAFLVTACLKDRQVQFVRVRSEAGGPCKLRNPFDGDARLVTDTGETKLQGTSLAFETKPGEVLWLAPTALEVPPPVILNSATEELLPALRRADKDSHFFGLKRLPRF